MSERAIQDFRAEVHYDPESGLFTRVKKSGNCRAGAVIGCKKLNGYVSASVFGKYHLCHRLAWAMTHGEFPPNDVDHINGDRTDNRIVNLRLATRAENMQNELRARASNKSSGLLGASWSKAASRWAAGIKKNGKKTHLGLFDTPEEAHAAYVTAKREVHPFGNL